MSCMGFKHGVNFKAFSHNFFPCWAIEPTTERKSESVIVIVYDVVNWASFESTKFTAIEWHSVHTFRMAHGEHGVVLFADNTNPYFPTENSSVFMDSVRWTVRVYVWASLHVYMRKTAII